MTWVFCKSLQLTCLFSKVLEKINNPHYLYCMTILQAISLLPPVMIVEITCQKLLPVVIHSSKEMGAEITCKKLLPVAINSSKDRCVTRSA
jgi:hypothetical protein